MIKSRLAAKRESDPLIDEDENEEEQIKNAAGATCDQVTSLQADVDAVGDAASELLTRHAQQAAAVEGAAAPEGGEQIEAAVKSAVEADFEKAVYESTFDDYAEIAVQFGFVTLFVTAFPLAPVLALLNNYVEIRVDAAKLTLETQRPFPYGAEDIGTWATVFDVVSRIGIITNTAIVVFLTDIIPSNLNGNEWETYTYRLIAFVAAEVRRRNTCRPDVHLTAVPPCPAYSQHLILILRYLMGLIPDMPRAVDIQLKRQEFINDKLILELPDEVRPPPGGCDGAAFLFSGPPRSRNCSCSAAAGRGRHRSARLGGLQHTDVRHRREVRNRPVHGGLARSRDTYTCAVTSPCTAEEATPSLSLLPSLQRMHRLRALHTPSAAVLYPRRCACGLWRFVGHPVRPAVGRCLWSLGRTSRGPRF